MKLQLLVNGKRGSIEGESFFEVSNKYAQLEELAREESLALKPRAWTMTEDELREMDGTPITPKMEKLMVLPGWVTDDPPLAMPRLFDDAVPVVNYSDDVDYPPRPKETPFAGPGKALPLPKLF